MNNIEILTMALEYIENNLTSEIKTETVAAACYCSKASLEKIFRFLSHISVHDYVIRRRMMFAARMIAKEPEKSLLEVAVECGYSTNESFGRAFKSVWNCNPSEFRNNTRYFELYPRLRPLKKGDVTTMSKHVDITELYELFKERKNCYFVCGDIKHLVPINEISHKAGDLAILESLKRMESVAGEDDLVFRIGGDEFVILTNNEDALYADEVCEKLNGMNGQTISFEGREIPLDLHIAITKLTTNGLRYSEMFEQLHKVLNDVKR